ncbi:MAG: hypothetical protein WDN75_05450 [Bacteroidota bacterium]
MEKEINDIDDLIGKVLAAKLLEKSRLVLRHGRMQAWKTRGTLIRSKQSLKKRLRIQFS